MGYSRGVHPGRNNDAPCHFRTRPLIPSSTILTHTKLAAPSRPIIPIRCFAWILRASNKDKITDTDPPQPKPPVFPLRASIHPYPNAGRGSGSTMSYYFAIVGTQDNPLFEYEFGTSKQGGDGQSRFTEQVRHLNQFILHSSLDIAEEVQWSHGQM